MILKYLAAHSDIIFTIFYYHVLSAFFSALEAPTATSSSYYRFFFKFCNYFAANYSRAISTRIENSPNFVPALVKYTNGGDTPVAMLPYIDPKTSVGDKK